MLYVLLWCLPVCFSFWPLSGTQVSFDLNEMTWLNKVWCINEGISCGGKGFIFWKLVVAWLHAKALDAGFSLHFSPICSSKQVWFCYVSTQYFLWDCNWRATYTNVFKTISLSVIAITMIYCSVNSLGTRCPDIMHKTFQNYTLKIMQSILY